MGSQGLGLPWSMRSTCERDSVELQITASLDGVGEQYNDVVISRSR